MKVLALLLALTFTLSERGFAASEATQVEGFTLSERGVAASEATRVEGFTLSERGFAASEATRVEGQTDAIPELTAPVNDFARVIDAASREQLDALVRKVQSATGDVIVVATVNTFKPEGDMQSYTVKMFQNHGKGIGTGGKDNGVLILLAIEDREVRIEPGYGLEGFITDGFSGETSRSMLPFFRSGNYGQGLVSGATRVAQRIAEGRNVNLDLAAPPQAQTARRSGGGFPIGFWVILLIIFLNVIGRGRRRRGRWVSGVGPFGGGFGGGGFGGGGFGGGGFGGFGGGRSGGGGGGASW
jgi:uncharacterized protein